MTDRTPDFISENSINYIVYISNRMPDRISKNGSDRMPECMSDGMP